MIKNNIIVDQHLCGTLLKKFLFLWNSACSAILCYKEPNTGPYPEPDKSSPHPQSCLIFILNNTLSLAHLSLKSDLSLQDFD